MWGLWISVKLSNQFHGNKALWIWPATRFTRSPQGAPRCRRQPNNSRRNARSRSASLGQPRKAEFVAHRWVWRACPLSACCFFHSQPQHQPALAEAEDDLQGLHQQGVSGFISLCSLSLSLCYMTRVGGERQGRLLSNVKKQKQKHFETHRRSRRTSTSDDNRVNEWHLTFFFCHPAPVQCPRQNRWSSHLQCGHTVVGRRFMGNFLNALCVTKRCGRLLTGRVCCFFFLKMSLSVCLDLTSHLFSACNPLIWAQCCI